MRISDQQTLTVPEATLLASKRLECIPEEQITLQETLRRANEMGFGIMDLDDPVGDSVKTESTVSEDIKQFVVHVVDCLCRCSACWCPRCVLHNAHGFQLLLCAGLWLEDASDFAFSDNYSSRESRKDCFAMCREMMEAALGAIAQETESDVVDNSGRLLH